MKRLSWTHTQNASYLHRWALITWTPCCCSSTTTQASRLHSTNRILWHECEMLLKLNFIQLVEWRCSIGSVLIYWSCSWPQIKTLYARVQNVACESVVQTASCFKYESSFKGPTIYGISPGGYSTLEVTGVLRQQLETIGLLVRDFSQKKGVKRWGLDKFWSIFQAKYKSGHIFDKNLKKDETFDEMLSKKGDHLVRPSWKKGANATMYPPHQFLASASPGV